MKNLYLTLIYVFLGSSVFAQLPVSQSHPRIFLDPITKTKLLLKKTTNDADWLALKTEADNYATKPVMSWNPTNTGVWNTDYIFYNYCGSSWEEAAYALGFAHQLSKGTVAGAFPTTYSDKLLQLADTIISGYAAYPACYQCPNMFLWNSTYATRHMGPVLGVIYDWCYDELGDTRKAALIALMENFFAYMRVPFNVYQNTDHASGNYFFGQVLCAANMGYALMYDSPKAQEMIDFSRQRVLGTHSGTLGATDLSKNWVKQTYTGNTPSSASKSYLGPANYVSAPQKAGIPIQGWAYGSENMNRIIDYCFMVKSCTGEQIADSLNPFLSKTAEAFVHALTPNRFQVDNSNDWGSFLGNLLGYSLPLRLSAVLEGKPEGPAAQHTYTSWVQPVSLTASWNKGYPTLNWEKLLFSDNTRLTQAPNYSPYYPVPEDAVLSSVSINKTLPKYYVRENWSDTATWIALNMSCAYYDDHDHHNAGHFQIVRGDQHDGDDILLTAENEVGNQGAFGKNGIEGGTCYHMASSLSNNLFFDDFHDYVETNNSGHTSGGQSFYGYDEPTHTEQNDEYSYIRADLSSAYHRKGELADTVNATLKRFQRSFLYLRETDVVLVYDRILAKNSTNQNGQYKKHLRWHFLENPVISGNNLVATMDNSKLFVHAVLPAAVSINKVDESNNPDNVFGAGLNYAFNTYTWRAEVSVPGNPLQQDLLTVFQPGGLTAAEMTTTNISTIESNMEGAMILANGKKDLVLFNTSTAKYLNPVTVTSYAFTNDSTVLHTLCGMEPGGIYQVDFSNGIVSVNSSTEGNYTASPSGVLRYTINTSGTGIEAETAENSFYFNVYPNPSSGTLLCNWENKGETVQKIEIRNALGQLISVYKQAPSAKKQLINIEQSGVYTLTIISDKNQLEVRKVIVSK